EHPTAGARTGTVWRANEARFAGTVWSDQRDDLAGVNLERDIPAGLQQSVSCTDFATNQTWPGWSACFNGHRRAPDMLRLPFPSRPPSSALRERQPCHSRAPTTRD